MGAGRRERSPGNTPALASGCRQRAVERNLFGTQRVKGEGDGEGDDLTYPRSTTIAEEVGKGVREGGERKTLRREGEGCGWDNLLSKTVI